MSWLSDPATQKTLTFVCGGVAAVATGAWAVFKFFRQRPAAPAPTLVTADNGSLAAGRDVNFTLPPKP